MAAAVLSEASSCWAGHLKESEPPFQWGSVAGGQQLLRGLYSRPPESVQLLAGEPGSGETQRQVSMEGDPALKMCREVSTYISYFLDS